MKKIIFILLLIISTNHLFAQYLHYWDDSRPRRNTQAAPNPKPAEKEKPVEIIAPPIITNPVKIDPIILVSSVRVNSTGAIHAPKIIRPPIIFHQWPDLCPGLSGSIPVLNNYVPKEILLILKEKFKGHLYSISSYKGQGGKQEYKLKVCADGMIKYEYANAMGNIMPEQLN